MNDKQLKHIIDNCREDDVHLDYIFKGDIQDWKDLYEQLQRLAWMPIESAPRDGTKILAYRPLAEETNDPVLAIVETTDHPTTSPQGIKHYTKRWCHPTHWMPPPPTPKDD